MSVIDTEFRQTDYLRLYLDKIFGKASSGYFLILRLVWDEPGREKLATGGE